MRLRASLGLVVVSCLSACQEPLSSEGELGVAEQASQCGPTWDGEGVEQMTAAQLVSRDFVAAHERSIVIFHFNDDLATVDADHDGLGDIMDPGNLAGGRWCTGTLLANNMVLTAAHCLHQGGFAPDDYPYWRKTGRPLTLEEFVTRTHVAFRYQNDPSGNPRTISEAPVDALADDGGGDDFTVVHLEGTEPSYFGATPLAFGLPDPGDVIAMIQHPATAPKEVTSGHLFSQSATEVQPGFVTYGDVDTLGGSSGAGVLWGANGGLFALHTDGGCDDYARNYVNYGLPISRLLRAPVIRRVATSQATIYGRESVLINDRAKVYGVYGYGTIVSAGTTNIGVSAIVGDVWGSQTVTLRGGTIDGDMVTKGSFAQQAGSTVTGLTRPNAKTSVPEIRTWTGSYPWFLAIAPSVGLEPGQSRVFAPGIYGDLSIKTNATATFQIGTYFIRSLTVEPGGNVVLNAANGTLLVHVRDNIIFRGKMTYGTGTVENAAFYCHGSYATISAPFKATLFAPNADITVDSSTSAHLGGFYGKTVSLHQGNSVFNRPFLDWELFKTY